MGNKKILILIGSFKTGGAERMAINTGENLRFNGFDVYYLLQKDIFQIPNNIPNNKIIVINRGCKINKYLSHLKSFFYAFYINLKLRPYVVIGFSYYSSFLACFTFSKRIIARFDTYPYYMIRPWKHFIASFVSYWPSVRYIVAPSEGIGNKLKTVNKRFLQKIRIIYNSIDTNLIIKLSNQPNPFPIKENYIVAMGRFSFHKNFSFLIEAYNKSILKNKYKLVIIGDGHKKDELNKLIKKLNLKDKVILTGFISNPFPILKESYFFVNPSLLESFCNVLVEALVLNVPVLATDCDFGPSEIVKNFENGLLIESNNLDQMITSLNYLSINENLSSFKINSYNSSQKFDINIIGNKWVSLINNLK